VGLESRPAAAALSGDSLRRLPAKVVGYPAIYASALLARRRQRSRREVTPAEALEFARSFRWYGGEIHPTQNTEEILWLLGILEREPPRTVVEIGTDQGGTLYLWTRVAASDAVLVAIDTRPLGLLGQRSPYALVRRGFARDRQRVELILPADSHDPATVGALERAVGARRVDFLFIDGDHSYKGVRRDFELYSPLVRSGGLVALHDIASPIAPGVSRFWEELKGAYETDERIASDLGIGVVRTP
jgi:predicted O-methyltransferase YrrM